MEIRMHTKDDAPAGGRESLERVERKYGFIPNLAATMAQAPGLLHAYLETEEAFRASGLSPAEQEVVALTVSFHNKCSYCMAAHSMLASMAGVEPVDLDALRGGRPLASERLEALRQFTLSVLGAHGGPVDEATDRFLTAGFSREQALAVPLGVGFKMLSNLTHLLQNVPADAPFAPFAWNPEEGTAGQNGKANVLVTGWVRAQAGDVLAQYQAAAGPVMKRHGGAPALKASPSGALVGSKPDLVVLMTFPSPEAAAAAFADPDYEKLVPLRERAFERLDVATL